MQNKVANIKPIWSDIRNFVAQYHSPVSINVCSAQVALIT